MNKILWQDKAIWSASAINNSGQITTITTGPLMRKYQYDAYGLPTERQVTNTANRTIMQSFNYSFSPITGNLEWRKDRKHTSSENFLYDDFNRLKSFNGSTASYDNKGNITSLSSVGSMTYSAAKPYAIESLTLSANSLQNTDQQSVSYNKMNLPSTITQGGKTATFTYNGSGERVRMSIPKPSTAGRIVGGFYDIHYYLGSKLEIIYDQSTKENKYIFYIGGDAYDAPAVSVQKGNLEWKTYYICRDYLGSITLITDASGNSVQELSYDAWGNLRDPLTYQVYACGKAPELFLGRGYTGHEHLSTFGLINMNARLYDPVLGRFLSPDPYVQMPDNLQSFNRYTYGMNNPLLYTDPDGEFWHIVIGALVGGTINWISNGCEFNAEGLAYFGTGALAGGLAAGFPGAGLYITAGLGAANSALNQGFTNGWSNINLQQVGMDAGISYLTAVAGSAFASNLSGPIGNLVDKIKSPILKSVAASELVGVPLGAFMGGLGALGDGDQNTSFWDGAWRGAKSSIATSAVSGIGVAAQYALDKKVDFFTGKKKTPTQVHHFATNKNSKYTPLMEEIIQKYGLKLDENWNKGSMEHSGRHPNKYHKWVLEQMKAIDKIPGMDQQKFIKLYKQRVILPVLEKPLMLRKEFWTKK